MKEAIQKAIEGGYKVSGYGGNTLLGVYDSKNVSWQFITTQPLFWQSLGKALGWKFSLYHRWVNQKCTDCKADMKDTPLRDTCFSRSPEWKYHWHRFINHLAEGKEVDEFFKELLR